jgi:adenosine deaminase CECR1
LIFRPSLSAGQEDKGKPLIDFLPALLSAAADGIPTFYHAAETNWQGQSTDINVIDALLLNVTRSA